MQIQSPISNLREVLSQVQKAAAAYQQTLKSNEDATRAALVDPVLRALGWDIGNPNMVEVEKTLGGPNPSKVDYALFNDSSQIKAIVEAKSSSQNLGSHSQQLVKYAFSFQVTSLFLTNGLIWHHYTNFSPTNFVPTRVLYLASDDLAEVAAYLVQELDAAKFWPAQPDVDVLEQEVAQLKSDLSDLQQQVKQLASVGPTPPPIKPPPTLNWTDLSSVTTATRTKPSLLRLPNNTPITVRSWKEVLIETCKFVLAHNLQLPVPYGDASGRAVNLIADVAPPKGLSFVSIPYNGQTLYLYTTYSADNCVKNALHILSLLPSAQQAVTPAVVYAPIQ